MILFTHLMRNRFFLGSFSSNVTPCVLVVDSQNTAVSRPIECHVCTSGGRARAATAFYRVRDAKTNVSKWAAATCARHGGSGRRNVLFTNCGCAHNVRTNTPTQCVVYGDDRDNNNISSLSAETER